MKAIRDLVTKTLNELGYGDAKSRGEQLVCSDRYQVGVRFVFDGVSAIWMNEAGHVRFVDDSGMLIKVVRLRSRQKVVGEAA
jgi:hypothetical protein